jgi:hypothetical protein
LTSHSRFTLARDQNWTRPLGRSICGLVGTHSYFIALMWGQRWSLKHCCSSTNWHSWEPERTLLMLVAVKASHHTVTC